MAGTGRAERIDLGQVVKPVGLRGELKLRASADFWDAALASAHLGLATGAGERAVRVLGHRPHGAGIWVLRLEGVEDLDAAAALVGAALWIESDAIDVEPPSELRPFQVRGFRVLRRSGEPVGIVEDLLPMPAQPLLVVRDGGREHWIPWVPSIVIEFDSASGIVRIDPPEGLLDLES